MSDAALKPPIEAEEGWTLIAWHGVSFWVPEDWTLIPVSDPKETRVQVASPGSFTIQARAQKAKPGVDLHPILDSYLKGVESQAKKRRVSFTGKVNAAKSGDGLEYTWRADVKTHGVARQCEQCHKVLIAEVSGSKDDPVLATAHRIFNTLKDHPEDGWQPWGAFGLITACPENYRLDSFKFTSGYISMNFHHRGNTLTIERWGLAYLALEKFSLDQWAMKAGRWNRAKGELEQTTIRGHEAYRWKGRFRPLLRIQEVAQSLPKAKIPTFNLTGAAWHCAESNRLYVITWQHRKPIPFDELLERTVCHF